MTKPTLKNNIRDVLLTAPQDDQVLAYSGGYWVNVDNIAASGGGHVIQDEGIDLTQRTKLNFVGPGVTVTDDSGNDATKVTIVGGSGGGDMYKATYDANDNGVVDLTEAAPWAGITGKPATYPPSFHNHATISGTQYSGVAKPYEAYLNFLGNVTVVDDPGNNRTNITVVGGAGGGGDMYKSVYDTNSNGVVDSAEAVAWAGITGKPATYPPSLHNHPVVSGTQLSGSSKPQEAYINFLGYVQVVDDPTNHRTNVTILGDGNDGSNTSRTRYVESLTGTTSFTTTHNFVSASLVVYLNGLAQNPSYYTVTGANTFTTSFTKGASDELVAAYDYVVTEYTNTVDDSWISPAETWTYASASTFTIPGDVRSKYPTGTKLKLTNSTVKYFYVIGLSYSSPNTTVTVTGGSDYIITNTTISDNYYSYGAVADGFPPAFNWTPTYTGFSADPTGAKCRFWIAGRMCTINISMPSNGTSNANTFTMTIPVTPMAVETGLWWYGTAIGLDNGALMSTPAAGGIISGGSTVNFFKDCSLSNIWTTSGGKRIVAFQISYPIQ